MAKLVPGLNTFRPLTATMHVECVVLGDQERMSYPYK